MPARRTLRRNPLGDRRAHIRFYAGAPLVMAAKSHSAAVHHQRPAAQCLQRPRARTLQGFAALVKKRIETLHAIG